MIGVVPQGDHDLIPEMIDLGGGNLATLLDTEIEIRHGDHVFFLASTDGNGIDVFGVRPDAVGNVGEINLSSILGVLTDDNIRSELFDQTGQPTALDLNVHQITQSGPVLIGNIGPKLANQVPTVLINTPLDGSSFAVGTSIAFAGMGTDTEDGDLTAKLSWTSSLDGVIGAGGSFSSVLSVGVHTITAAVTDSGGSSGSDYITVTVQANAAPVVTITSPAAGSTFPDGTSITFAAAASDAEDGN